MVPTLTLGKETDHLRGSILPNKSSSGVLYIRLWDRVLSSTFTYLLHIFAYSISFKLHQTTSILNLSFSLLLHLFFSFLKTCLNHLNNLLSHIVSTTETTPILYFTYLFFILSCLVCSKITITLKYKNEKVTIVTIIANNRKKPCYQHWWFNQA